MKPVRIEPQKKLFHPNPASLLSLNFRNFWAVEIYMVCIVLLCILFNYISYDFIN